MAGTTSKSAESVSWFPLFGKTRRPIRTTAGTAEFLLDKISRMRIKNPKIQDQLV